MTEDARRRLEAIREANELGMGYSIAMRDLEIRGAGDLLGSRQSGHISAVGFDLYTRLLQRAVSEMKALRDGTPAPSMPLTGVNIDLPLQAHVPTDYVTNEGLRLQLYRRMGNITTAEEIDLLAQELADRFGSPPKAVENLMFQLHLKVLAATVQVSAIVRDRERNNIVIKCEALEHADRFALQKRLGSAAAVQRREVHIANDETWRIKLVKVLQEMDVGG